LSSSTATIIATPAKVIADSHHFKPTLIITSASNFAVALLEAAHMTMPNHSNYLFYLKMT
jgi:hypothetical protein